MRQKKRGDVHINCDMRGGSGREGEQCWNRAAQNDEKQICHLPALVLSSLQCQKLNAPEHFL